MKRIGNWAAAGIIILCFCSSVYANGCYWPEVAYAKTPAIPLQRAMISFRDGKETLIVESTFQTDSPSVGWVLPLPAEPTSLTVADAGMLTSLSHSLRPDVVHDLHTYLTGIIAILVLTVPAAVGVVACKNSYDGKRRAFRAVVLFYVFLILLSSVFLPVIGSSAGMGSAAPGVAVQQMQRVGNYDVAMLRAKSAEALAEWLKANGLRAPTAAQAKIIADYISRNWCFVAAKLRREDQSLATPHPIAATFPTKTPVFPMRLTAIAQSTTRVELFIAAAEGARADGFEVAACDKFSREARGRYTPNTVSGYAGAATGMIIGNPDAGGHLWDGCVVTKLQTDLSPAQMGKDVTISFSPSRPTRQTVWSHQGRRGMTLCVLLSGLVVMIVSVAVVFRFRRRPQWKEVLVLLIVAGGLTLAGSIVNATLPVVEVAAGRYPFYFDERRMQQLDMAGLSLCLSGRLDASTSGKEMAAVPELLKTTDHLGHFAREVLPLNPLTGKAMQNERTPGNFCARTVGNTRYLCFYDLEGREMRIKLPGTPAATSQP